MTDNTGDTQVPDTADARRDKFFFSFPPRLSREPPMLPATLFREEMEPRAFLVRSDTEPDTEVVSVARTVKPILTCQHVDE